MKLKGRYIKKLRNVSAFELSKPEILVIYGVT